MPTRKLSALLSDTAGFSALTQATQRITALQRLYGACTPPDLAQASRAIDIRNGMLVIAADNGAIAAKLRQMTPGLLKKMQKQSGEVTGIRVEVQVGRAAKPAAPKSLKLPLLIDSIEKIESLSGRVKDPALRAALTRFAARRRSGA